MCCSLQRALNNFSLKINEKILYIQGFFSSKNVNFSLFCALFPDAETFLCVCCELSFIRGSEVHLRPNPRRSPEAAALQRGGSEVCWRCGSSRHQPAPQAGSRLPAHSRQVSLHIQPARSVQHFPGRSGRKLSICFQIKYKNTINNVWCALQGILFAEPQTLGESCDLALLWLHESCRVYSDRLVDVTDMQLFRKLQMETAHECFEVQCTF